MTTSSIQDTMHTNLTKVRFPLKPEDWEGLEAENLWAEIIGPDQYRLRNSPFYAYGVSVEDVVYAKESENVLNFAGIARRGGHSTYRILLPEGDSIRTRGFLTYWEPMENIGCTYELAKERWLAVDVPPRVDIFEVYALLEKGETEGAWSFEEGHCGHSVKDDASRK
jgi:hypothetical protein